MRISDWSSDVCSSDLVGNGEIGAGTMFGGDSPDPSFAFPAADYNTIWKKVLHLSSRPANFHQLVAERWGMPLADKAHPYPLPGEAPNASKRGSGVLPIGLTPLRNTHVSWTANIAVTRAKKTRDGEEVVC